MKRASMFMCLLSLLPHIRASEQKSEQRTVDSRFVVTLVQRGTPLKGKPDVSLRLTVNGLFGRSETKDGLSDEQLKSLLQHPMERRGATSPDAQNCQKDTKPRLPAKDDCLVYVQVDKTIQSKVQPFELTFAKLADQIKRLDRLRDRNRATYVFIEYE